MHGIRMTNHSPGWSSALLVALLVMGPAAAKQPVVIPIELVDNSPVINVKIDGRNVPLVFDSGNSAAWISRVRGF